METGSSNKKEGGRKRAKSNTHRSQRKETMASWGVKSVIGRGRLAVEEIHKVVLHVEGRRIFIESKELRPEMGRGLDLPSARRGRPFIGRNVSARRERGRASN